MSTYVPPACGKDLVTNSVPATDFWGWRCGDCGGPLRLTDFAARAMTGHLDATDNPAEGILVHDLKSSFYWKEEEQ